MKKVSLFVLTAVIAVSISGCGKKKEIVNSELSSAISGSVSFSEKLTELDGAAAERRYGLNAKDYSEITALVGTNGVCDEYLIVKTSNTDAMVEKLNKYLEDKHTEYESYRPVEAEKLLSPMIETYKGTVVMVITADLENAQSVYQGYLKK